jgi:hypothetical protein
VKERPILFKSDMINAIRDNCKTMTRRVIKPQMPYSMGENCKLKFTACPYGQIGDRLWVRERFSLAYEGQMETDTGYIDVNPLIPYQDKIPKELQENLCVSYYADFNSPLEAGDGYWPSIFMPRWASRITLEITSIRVERVQDISEQDAIAEGINPEEHPFDAPPIMQFALLWDSINAKRGYSWGSNPSVWVVEFKNLEAQTESDKDGQGSDIAQED